MLMIALVCSLFATPDRRDCTMQNSLRHMVIGQVDNSIQCGMYGQQYLASPEFGHKWDSATEYPKVMCAITDIRGDQG